MYKKTGPYFIFRKQCIISGKISPELEAATEKLAAAERKADARSEKLPEFDLATAVPKDQLKRSRTSRLYEAMEWARIQNEKAGSPYKGKLATTAIAVMGASCGGLQALDAALGPGVKTAVIINSGIMRTGIPEGEEVRKVMEFQDLSGPDDLKKLHVPVIYLNGGPTDIAFENSEKDFEEIKNVFVFKGDLDVGHGGTFIEPHGGKFAEAATQWLLWQLKGDKKAEKMFLGENCGICTDPEWKVKRKNQP